MLNEGMFDFDKTNQITLKIRIQNIGFVFLLTLFFGRCTTNENGGLSILPVSLRSTESRLIDLYTNYAQNISAVELPNSVSKTKKDLPLLAEFKKSIATNPDLLFYPATLCQMFILKEESAWEQLAINYTNAIQKVALNNHAFSGEVVESVYLNLYIRNRNSDLLEAMVECLSVHISSYESKRSGANRNAKDKNHLNLLLENEVLFCATKETGDPVFKQFAIENSSDLYEKHFQNNLRMLSVLKDEINKEQIEQLTTDDFYKLAVGVYGFFTLYEETQLVEYIRFCEKIAFLFDCIYNVDNHSLPKETKKEIDAKIDLVSKSLVSIALFNLSQYSDKLYDEVSSEIYASTIHELELVNKDKLETQSNSKDKCSFRLFYYLFEYEIRKQNEL